VRGAGLPLAVQKPVTAKVEFLQVLDGLGWAGRDCQGHSKSLIFFRLLLGQLSLAIFQHNNLNLLL